MYTTDMGKPGDTSAHPLGPVEDPERLAAFEARVADDEFIEPRDWMPDAYRRTLVRQISHGDLGALGESAGRDRL